MKQLFRSKYLVAGVVALLAFLVYLPSLQNGFINHDDDAYVYENHFIRSFDAQLLKSSLVELHSDGNWHPLTWFSHALDYAVWGLNPLGHHLTNTILHGLNTFVVVLLSMMLMEVLRSSPGNGNAARPLLSDRFVRSAGATTGLLFGLHPIHVESVAWISERKDLLSAFFYLLTIMAYTSSVRDRGTAEAGKRRTPSSNRMYLLALALFVLSIASKPMGVSLPFVLLLLDWYPIGRIRSLNDFRTAAGEKRAFFAIAFLVSILTIVAQQFAGAIGSLNAFPLATRALVACMALTAYLGKLLVPIHLVPLYPYPESVSPLSLQYGIPLVIAAALTTACLLVVRKQKLWAAVWFYFVITLLPVSGIVQVGHQAMADRYEYLPSLGPLFVLGLLAAWAYEKTLVLGARKEMVRFAGPVIGLAVVVALSFATIRQTGIWNNSIVFWNYVIDNEPTGVPDAHNNLGVAYLSDGQTEAALEQFQAAVREKPDYADAHCNLGTVYIRLGLFDTAIEHFRTALMLKPDYVDAYNDLGNAYLSEGRLDLAIEPLQSALRLDPGLPEAHFNLGLLYLKKGMTNAAQAEFEAGLMINPNNEEARKFLRDIASGPHA